MEEIKSVVFENDKFQERYLETNNTFATFGLLLRCRYKFQIH